LADFRVNEVANCRDVEAAVAQMQGLRSELPEVEGKDGRRGLPQRIYEPLSAFANRRGGGMIIFGLEDGMFRPVGDLDVARLQADLASYVDQKISYPIRLEFSPCAIGGEVVLAVTVPECPHQHKPVYYRNRGLIGGSYLRVGNSNHLLSEAEVRAILRSTERDDSDAQPVHDSAMTDLSQALIREYREALREHRPDSARLALGDDELLLNAQAVVRLGDRLVPTVGGLLFFAEEPQRWLPGAFVSFMQFAGTEVADRESAPERGGAVYLDNLRFDAPIPRVIEACRRAIFARIRRRALLEGFTRREVPEYPDWAYREAIVNAVAHRDYGLQGSHIQVRLFADRLEIQSPGGLFGTVSEANIETEQSTRNHVVVRLLEDHGLVEQRGIGIDRMVRAMLTAGLERPVFRDSLTSFLVVLKNHTMMDDDAYRWLAAFADYELTDHQRVALVYAWRFGKIVNRDYQKLNSVTSVKATQDLRRLVDLGLLRQHGTRGAAYYTLRWVPSLRGRPRRRLDQREEAILEHVRRTGRITNAEARALVGIPDVFTMRRVLRRLVRYGLLVQRGTAKKLTYYELGPEA
jgi:ATP-dependent DNA helicase RecG